MARLNRSPAPTDRVAWGLATWVAPFVPLATFALSLPLVWALGERRTPAALALGLAAVVLVLAGTALSRVGGRRARGLGYGLAAGGAMTAVGCVVGALTW